MPQRGLQFFVLIFYLWLLRCTPCYNNVGDRGPYNASWSTIALHLVPIAVGFVVVAVVTFEHAAILCGFVP